MRECREVINHLKNQAPKKNKWKWRKLVQEKWWKKFMKLSSQEMTKMLMSFLYFIRTKIANLKVKVHVTSALIKEKWTKSIKWDAFHGLGLHACFCLLWSYLLSLSFVRFVRISSSTVLCVEKQSINNSLDAFELSNILLILYCFWLFINWAGESIINIVTYYNQIMISAATGASTLPRDLIQWLDKLDLSYSVRNPKMDLANGFIVA